MSMKTVKRLAAEILKVGENRVKIAPAEAKRAEEALTRDDVRALIVDNVITAEPKRGVSRLRARKKQAQKKKGRRRGIGSRKGGKYSKVKRKTIWMNKVRAQRKTLFEYSDKGLMEEGSSYRTVYKMIKGGAFKGRGQMVKYLQDNKMLKER